MKENQNPLLASQREKAGAETFGKLIIKEGNSAEGSRATLAYYLSISSTVENYGNEIKSALVVDTSAQHEQSDSNYDKIVDILIMSDEAQIIYVRWKLSF